MIVSGVRVILRDTNFVSKYVSKCFEGIDIILGRSCNELSFRIFICYAQLIILTNDFYELELPYIILLKCLDLYLTEDVLSLVFCYKRIELFSLKF